MEKLGIIGFGVMGEAFAAGLRRQNPALEIRVFDVKGGRLASAASAHGLFPAGSVREVLRDSGLVILCVKPLDFQALAAEARPDSKGKRIISILSGRKISQVADGLATEQVARFMPNIAAVKGKSIIGVSFHEKAGSGFRDECLEIARALGEPLEIPERLMAGMTGVSGSGIAYALYFLHALSLGGVASGFDYGTALKIAGATVEGALSLISDGAHPMELVNRVTSAAGTTIQGVRALEKGGFAASVMEAVEAAARRAQELEG
jgi:pyrroline-5-carboxylate reductase